MGNSKPELDLKVLVEFNKAVTKDEQNRMIELGFVSSGENFRCIYIEPPYASYSKYKDDPRLKNSVQCPLYTKDCEIFSINNEIRPCIVLYNHSESLNKSK